MRNVERLSVTLPADLVRLIRSKVESGGYASNSEVICVAMQAWQEQERAGRLATVRARIAEADAETAPPLSDAEVDLHFARRQGLSRVPSKDHA